MTVVHADDYVQSAGELVQELVRVLKIRRLYDADHPQRREIESQATDRIAALLDAHGTIELKVEDEALLVEGNEVFRQAPGPESIAHVLYHEGIRGLVFYSGLTLMELTAFVDNVARAGRPEVEGEDGLVGRLWEEHFYHLRYTFVESLQDEEWTPPAAIAIVADGPPPPPVVLAAEDVPSEAEAVAAVDPSRFDTALYFLDDEDMASLQAELEAEKARALVHEALTCLRELLVDPVKPDTGPVLGALADMQRRLLEDGDYADVQKLHQLFIPYLEGPACTPAGREAFRALREDALSERTLFRLAARIEDATVEERTAAAYYRAFGRDDPLGLISRAGDLKRLCQRPAIATAFAELVRERPDALGEALAGEDPILAAAAAFLAGQVRDPRLVEGLGRALASEDSGVRREAIHALKQLGGGRAVEHVARAVEDPDPGVRLYALRHVVAHRYAPAFDRVAELIHTDRWRERPAAEQRLVFEAYGALGGREVLEDLARRVRPRGGLFRKIDPEEAACALVGLGAIGGAEARSVVEDARDSRLPLVARAAAQVLGAMGRATPRVSG